MKRNVVLTDHLCSALCMILLEHGIDQYNDLLCHYLSVHVHLTLSVIEHVLLSLLLINLWHRNKPSKCLTMKSKHLSVFCMWRMAYLTNMTLASEGRDINNFIHVSVIGQLIGHPVIMRISHAAGTIESKCVSLLHFESG